MFIIRRRLQAGSCVSLAPREFREACRGTDHGWVRHDIYQSDGAGDECFLQRWHQPPGLTHRVADGAQTTRISRKVYRAYLHAGCAPELLRLMHGDGAVHPIAEDDYDNWNSI